MLSVMCISVSISNRTFKISYCHLAKSPQLEFYENMVSAEELDLQGTCNN